MTQIPRDGTNDYIGGRQLHGMDQIMISYVDKNRGMGQLSNRYVDETRQGPVFEALTRKSASSNCVEVNDSPNRSSSFESLRSECRAMRKAAGSLNDGIIKQQKGRNLKNCKVWR